MSVGRQINWKGQMRVDVPHMRALESSIAYDFDTLAGRALAGDKPYILRGFTLIGTLGVAPTTWQMVTADSVVFHYTASENGTMLTVPSSRAAETLNTSNSRVTGGFTAGVDNYVGIDLIRAEDSTTSDIVQYVDATTLTATPKTVPLARTLDYRIVISSTPFTATTNVCPVAIVTVNASGNVTAVEDARTMYFRLAAGGVSPDPLGIYDWPQGRGVGVTPALENASFTGGDKAIGNEKDWKSAVMHRIWEVTGGEYWYSDTTDRNVKLACTTPTTLADNIVATPDAPPGATTVLNITWEGLRILLSNSTASVNTIVDNGPAPGDLGIDLAGGECLYVDVDRYTDGAALTMTLGVTSDLNAVPPTRVGSRYIIVWCEETAPGFLYAWSKLYGAPELGRAFEPLATSTVTGVVRTYDDQQVGGFPVVVNLTTDSVIDLLSPAAGTVPAITGTGAAALLALPAGYGLRGNGGTSVDGNAGLGVYAVGGNASGAGDGGDGLYAVGGTSVTGPPGTGIFADGGNTSQDDRIAGTAIVAYGGDATGNDTGTAGTPDGGRGIYALAGNSDHGVGGVGIEARGGTSAPGPGGHGVWATGGAGGAGQGGHGVYATGGSGTIGGSGVVGIGVVGANGVYGEGGPGAGTGVYGVGGTGGIGVHGESSVRGIDGTGTNTAGSVGVYGTSLNATGLGVQGVSDYRGVQGNGTNTAGSVGVYGTSLNATGIGVEGQSSMNCGVYGTGGTVGVSGFSSGSGNGVNGSSAGSGYGVLAQGHDSDGLHAESTHGYGASLQGNATKAPLHLAGLGGDPSSPEEGDIYFNAGNHHFYGYNGTTWVQLDN